MNRSTAYDVGACHNHPKDQPGLTCDMRYAHGGKRHAEQWKASWSRDGDDVRWNVADILFATRPRYRP